MRQVSNRFNLTFSFPELAKGDKIRPDGSPSVLRTVLPANETEALRIVMAKYKDKLQGLADGL